MKNKNEALDAVYHFIKTYLESEDEKSPEMVAAIAELIKICC